MVNGNHFFSQISDARVRRARTQSRSEDNSVLVCLGKTGQDTSLTDEKKIKTLNQNIDSLFLSSSTLSQGKSIPLNSTLSPLPHFGQVAISTITQILFFFFP